MKTSKTLTTLTRAASLAVVTACTDMSTEGQGTLSGGALGAAAGAGIAAIAGGNAATGALVGAAAGGIAGNIKGRQDYQRRY